MGLASEYRITLVGSSSRMPRRVRFPNEELTVGAHRVKPLEARGESMARARH